VTTRTCVSCPAGDCKERHRAASSPSPVAMGRLAGRCIGRTDRRNRPALWRNVPTLNREPAVAGDFTWDAQFIASPRRVTLPSMNGSCVGLRSAPNSSGGLL
jgi:hypothetical protein